jgi:hypothetical protein
MREKKRSQTAKHVHMLQKNTSTSRRLRKNSSSFFGHKNRKGNLLREPFTERERMNQNPTFALSATF